jgi:putative tryptophan/tyrosine transport system substrate-binding protein
MQFGQLKRREVITLIGGAAATWPLAARAQQSVSKIPRIGIIDPAAQWDLFRQGIRDLGYIEGRDIAIEYRSAEGQPEHLMAAATELAQLPVDGIVTFGSEATQAAKQATTTNPIVMAGIGDPVRAGFVASLARPGGNITGNTVQGPEVAAKRLQLLKLAVPTISRVAFLSGIPTILRRPRTPTSGKLPHGRWAWRCCSSLFAAPTSSTVPSPR